jgi:hypothetical protein
MDEIKFGVFAKLILIKKHYCKCKQINMLSGFGTKMTGELFVMTRFDYILLWNLHLTWKDNIQSAGNMRLAGLIRPANGKFLALILAVLLARETPIKPQCGPRTKIVARSDLIEQPWNRLPTSWLKLFTIDSKKADWKSSPYSNKNKLKKKFAQIFQSSSRKRGNQCTRE